MSKKEDIHKDKQIEIKNKLLDLLNINNDNKSFILYDIDKNIDLQNKILSLENDCEKYFAASTWTYFRNKREGNKNDRPYLLLIKNILSSCNIEIVNKQSYVKENNERIKTVKYYFV